MLSRYVPAPHNSKRLMRAALRSCRSTITHLPRMQTTETTTLPRQIEYHNQIEPLILVPVLIMSPSSSQSSQPARAPRRAARQRIRKDPPPLAVPDINDDAAERKRVLNVLAQRRYRELPELAQLIKDVGEMIKVAVQSRADMDICR